MMATSAGHGGAPKRAQRPFRARIEQSPERDMIVELERSVCAELDTALKASGLDANPHYHGKVADSPAIFIRFDPERRDAQITLLRAALRAEHWRVDPIPLTFGLVPHAVHARHTSGARLALILKVGAPPAKEGTQ